MKYAGRWASLGIALVACATPASRDAATSRNEAGDSAVLPATSGYVDSAISIEEALRRFRRDHLEPRELEGGLPSRDRLVKAFVQALEVRDTAALRRMVLRAGEFAWLYYPSSPLSKPPYELPPALMWFQMQGQSEKGASLLLAERAGGGLGYLGHTCATARREGDNRIYGHCVLRRVSAGGDTLAEPLFGLILERGGSYKFVSYSNKL
ncbi:MAG: hypothetical protein ACREMX_03860 [Gemmatimonadales bacterium]